MNKKKIVTLALVAIVAVMSIAGASLAYFTDAKTATNTFTMGNVAITLDEAPVDEKGHATTGNRVSSISYGSAAVYPGAVLDKDPTVHNTGSNGAYIRAKVTVDNWATLKTLYNSEDLTALVGSLGRGWSILSDETITDKNGNVTFVLKYDASSDNTNKEVYVLSNKDTEPIFEHVNVSANIENDTNDLLAKISVKAEAIQQNGFATWEAAFAAFDAE